MSTAAAHELLVITNCLDGKVGNGIALLPVVDAPDGHFPGDDTLDDALVDL